jgi:hypothetical protein
MNSALIHPFIARRQSTVNADAKHKPESCSALESLWAPVMIRLATAGDRLSLDYLAQLDSAELPSGALLIGELRGRPAVAVSLSDGSAIADPFLPTGDLLALVRLRAAQLGEQIGPSAIQRLSLEDG